MASSLLYVFHNGYLLTAIFSSHSVSALSLESLLQTQDIAKEYNTSAQEHAFMNVTDKCATFLHIVEPCLIRPIQTKSHYLYTLF